MKGITEANVLLALDAGLGETGWAIIHGQKGIHSGLIRIPGGGIWMPRPEYPS